MACPPGDPLDICKIILPPNALDPRDIHEILLPIDRLRWNLYKVILPSCGDQTCVFTFQPLDRPVVHFFFSLHLSTLNTHQTIDISVCPPPRHDSVVFENELETDNEVTGVGFGPAPRRSISRMAHDDSVVSKGEAETDDEVIVVGFGPAPRQSISRAHDDSVVSESEPETDNEVTIISFGLAAL